MPPPPRPVAMSQIVGLDLLRLAAALMVTVYHLTYLEWANPHARGTAAAAPFLAYAGWTRYVDTGWVGVQIFFVISGFVIAYTASGRSPSAFLQGRVLRLVPGIWICATMSVFALFAGGMPASDVLKLYALSMTLFPIGPWVASSYWTLPLEIMFYGLVFLVLCRHRFDRIEPVVLVLGGMSLAAWLAAVATIGVPGATADAVRSITTHRIGKLLLVQHGCFFAIGALIWMIREWGATWVRIGAIAAFIVGGVIQIVMEAFHASAWAGLPMSPIPPVVAMLAALAFIAAALRWNGVAHRMLGRKVGAVRTMGLMTYPVYLLHQPFGLLASNWQLRAGVDPAVALVLSVTLVLGISWLVAMRFEPPLRTWMRARFTALSARNAPGVPAAKAA